MEAIIECDYCKEQFDINKNTLGSAKLELEKGLAARVSYFVCPHCGYKYPFLIEDKKAHEYLLQQRSVQKVIDLKKRKGKKVSDALLRELNSLFKISKEYQTVLRDKYYTAVTTQLNKKVDFDETNS